MLEKIKAMLFGLSVGDALGVPVEFNSRETLTAFPVTDMRGYGSWSQPPGTWSDDSSLAFCLAESLTQGYSLEDMAQKFIAWYQTGYWGAHHKVFDIGGATRYAIQRLMNGYTPLSSGGTGEDDNGNGSLMRILPLLVYLKDLPIEERYQLTKEVSATTHAHFRSVFSCFIYLEFARNILSGLNKKDSYIHMQRTVNDFKSTENFKANELSLFENILKDDISKRKVNSIASSGYVVSTLQASLWSILTTDSYSAAVLRSVNLGGDTDTSACVTGGLAGLYYGYDSIPETWINQLARKDDIMALAIKLSDKYK